MNFSGIGLPEQYFTLKNRQLSGQVIDDNLNLIKAMNLS
jgi:hypothetical protein